MDHPAPAAIADALVFIHCAHTSLQTLRSCGMLDRELPLYRALSAHFPRTVMVSYGDDTDAAIARSILPGEPGRLTSICNDQRQDPAVFLSAVPDRIARLLPAARSALVLTDQHYGGDVAVCIARSLRHRGVRTGLVARGGYHWAWFVAREEGPDSLAFAQARYLESELIHAADITIGTTRRMIDDLAMLHGAPRDRFRLVPNYVAADRPPPPFEHRHPGLILAAGRLHPQKRFDLLMHAAAALPPAIRSQCTLLIFGQGPDEARLKDLAARLPVRIDIRPRVPHGELVEAMHRCSVYAQCSEYEGHPKTIIEALAHGCPTLVTDGPGVSDAVIAGGTGLVTPGDPRHIAAGLATLLTDRTLAARLGAAAAETTRHSLDFDAVFPFYRQACIDAMTTAGANATMPPAIVRWDQPMLRLPPDTAAAAWHAGLNAFARRLDPSAREEFLQRLGERLESLRDPTPAASR